MLVVDTVNATCRSNAVACVGTAVADFKQFTATVSML